MLAAGAARRFGGDKLLATVGGKPLLQYAIDAACGAQVAGCTLVLGAGQQRVLAGVDTRRCAIAMNERWRDGIASSIRCGLRAQRDADACIILIGDQPFVASADLDQLIETFGGGAFSIVALRAGGTWGSPILFPRRDFAGLMRLSGDTGAKRLAARQEKRLVFVDAADARAFVDIDTRDDLNRLREPETPQTRR